MRIPVHLTRASMMLAALALLAGCGQAKTAEPVPPAASMRDTVSPPAAPSSEAPAGLGALDPCGLLSSADRSSAGLSVLGKPKAIGRAKGCDWTEPGTFGVTVTVDAEHAPTELSVEKGSRHKTKAGDRTAYEVADREAANGVCAVLMTAGKGGSASVDVSNANFRDTDLACERAKTVAGLIAPKLP